jgi:hypothetical protein
MSFSGIQGSSKNLKTYDADGDYYLWIQNRATKQVFFAEVALDGTFSLPIGVSTATQGDDFFVGVVSKDPLEFIGPVTLMTSGSVGSTGMIVDTNISGVTMNFNLTNKTGTLDPAAGSGVTLNADMEVRLSNGTPVGAGNDGKGAAAMISTLNSSNTIDRDQDGMPDMFDAMNNGQELDNSVDGSWVDMTAQTTKMDKGIMFMNLKIDNALSSSYTVTNDAVIVLEFLPQNASNISLIKALRLHTNYTACQISRLPGGFTEVDPYPSTGTLWSADSYKLYKATNQSGSTVWTVLLTPKNNSFAPGQLVLIEATYTNGTKDYFWMSVNFKFERIPSDTTTWTSGNGSQTTPYVIGTTGGTTLTYTAPLDETGNALTGIEYSLELFFYDANHMQVGDRQVITIGEDVMTATLTEAQIEQYASLSPKSMQIDITARYPYGDNAARKIYVKRSNW